MGHRSGVLNIGEYQSTGLTTSVERRFVPVLMLMALGALVGGYYFTGLYGSDDLQYVAGALGLGGSVPEYATLGGGRYTVTAPLRLFLSLAGGDLQLAVAGFTLLYIASAFVVYALVASFAGRRVAAIAGVLVIANPLLFIYSGAVLPDNILAASFTCSVLLLARWCYGADTERAKAKLLVLVGVSAGLCYVTKEASLVFLLPLCVYTAYSANRDGGWWRLGASVALGLAGFVIVLAMDMAISTYTFGHPFARLAYASELDLVDGLRSFMDRQGTYPWERLKTVWDQIWSSWPGVVIYLAAAVYLAVIRGSFASFVRSADGVVALSAAWTFAYLTWGSVSLREYIGVPIQERYFAPVAVLLCVLLARAAGELHKRHSGGSSWPAVVGLALLVGWQVTWPLERAGNIYRAVEHRELSALVVAQKLSSPSVPIFVDRYFYLRGARYGHLPIAGPLASTAPAHRSFVYVYNPTARSRNAAESAVLGCVSNGGIDVSGFGRSPVYPTRLQTIGAGLGFHGILEPVLPGKVRAIFVADMERCLRQ